MNRIDQYQNPEDETFRDPQTIENEISHTRERIDEHVSRLTEKLDPRDQIEDLSHWLQCTIEDFDLGKLTTKINEIGGRAAKTVQENPVPFTLIGAGAAWLLFNNARSGRGVDKKSPESDPSADAASNGQGHSVNATNSLTPSAPETPNFAESNPDAEAPNSHSNGNSGQLDAIREVPEKAADIAKKTTDTIERKAKAGGRFVTGTLSQVAAKSGEATNAAKKRIEDSGEKQPGLMGAGALALGFLAALSIPGTRREDELCGEQSDRWKQQTRKKIDGVVPSAGEIATKSEEAIERAGDGAVNRIDEKLSS